MSPKISFLYVFFTLNICFQNPAWSQTPLARANRILAIAVNETENITYDQALESVSATGLTAVSLPYSWEDLERRPGVYAPEPNFLAIANVYYVGTGLRLSLGVNPIDTNKIRLPSDLKGKAWDDPLVIDRYKRLLDYVFLQITSLELTSLTIGNEIDASLSTPEDWAAYTRFFKEVADYARSFWPGLAVGTKGMMSGMTGPSRQEFQRINRYADVVMVTYYPLKEDFTVQPLAHLQTEFAKLVELYPDKPIYVMEIGCPSGEGLGSSERQQADFISAVFTMWDRYADHVQYVEFTWLHDQPEDQRDVWSQYYGIQDPHFREFLGTLGLRDNTGRNKAGFARLLTETQARGW
ncbi:MAG: hypothetical protein K8I00_06085 [Candidatus Omnitrophica bacterium]|nr:hypothetical protein [Candidatus Omnitrophota bacterium]